MFRHKTNHDTRPPAPGPAFVARQTVIAIHYQKQQKTDGCDRCHHYCCLQIIGRTVGLMLPCSWQRTVEAPGKRWRDINTSKTVFVFCFSSIFPTHFIKVVLFLSSHCKNLFFLFLHFVFLLFFVVIPDIYVAFYFLVFVFFLGGCCNRWRKSIRGT